MSLYQMYAGVESVLEVAAMAANLPRGGAVGEWVGGSMAITAELEAIWEQSHILAQVNSQKKIPPRKMPVGVRDTQLQQDREREQSEGKARALAEMKNLY